MMPRLVATMIMLTLSGGVAASGEAAPTAPHVLYTTGNATSAATGFDVDAVQSVAVRFGVTSASKPAKLDLWLMSNGPNATITATIVQGDAAAPKVSAIPLAASAPFRVKAVSWKPEMQTVELSAGQKSDSSKMSAKSKWQTAKLKVNMQKEVQMPASTYSLRSFSTRFHSLLYLLRTR